MAEKKTTVDMIVQNVSDNGDATISFTDRYPHPAVSVDCVVFGLTDGKLNVLFKGRWALPGGFVEIDEDLDTAAQREDEEETGLTDLFLEQLYTFGAVERDPRERVISIAYYALVNRDDHAVAGSSDAAQAVWFSIDNLPGLAFDHQSIKPSTSPFWSNRSTSETSARRSCEWGS